MTTIESLTNALLEDPYDRLTELALADALEESGARIESVARLRLPVRQPIRVERWEIYRYQSYPHDGKAGISIRTYKLGVEEKDEIYLDWIETRGIWVDGDQSPVSEAKECPQDALAALEVAIRQLPD